MPSARRSLGAHGNAREAGEKIGWEPEPPIEEMAEADCRQLTLYECPKRSKELYFMKVLITGANGFVGQHVIEELGARFPSAQIIATSKNPTAMPGHGEITGLDVTDRVAVEALVEEHSPTHVAHLAGIASPATAASDPDLAWQVHLHGTLNVAYAILKIVPQCGLLFVGSGMVYGASARKGLPLSEEALLQPLDEYASTKAAADLALYALAQRGLKVVRARPFNHTGAGQQPVFAAPSFAMQIAKIEAGLQPPKISVGNLTSERDLLDVRDVASAYAMILGSFDSIPSGIALNIASGRPLRMQTLLDELIGLATIDVEVVRDEMRVRPGEISKMVGDPTQAQTLLGWLPRHELSDTLRYLLEDCRRRVCPTDR